MAPPDLPTSRQARYSEYVRTPGRPSQKKKRPTTVKKKPVSPVERKQPSPIEKKPVSSVEKKQPSPPQKKQVSSVEKKQLSSPRKKQFGLPPRERTVKKGRFSKKVSYTVERQ